MRRRLFAFLLLCGLCAVRLPAATVQRVRPRAGAGAVVAGRPHPGPGGARDPGGPPPPFIARRVLAPIRSVSPPGGPAQPVHNGLLLQALTDADRRHDIAKMRALEQQIATLRASLPLLGSPRRGRGGRSCPGCPCDPGPPGVRERPVPAAAAVRAHRGLARSAVPQDPLAARAPGQHAEHQPAQRQPGLHQGPADPAGGGRHRRPGRRAGAGAVAPAGPRARRSRCWTRPRPPGGGARHRQPARAGRPPGPGAATTAAPSG